MIFFISPDLRDDILSKTKCNWPDFLFLGNVKETINYKTSDLIDGANDDSVSFDNYYILHKGIKRLLFDLWQHLRKKFAN